VAQSAGNRWRERARLGIDLGPTLLPMTQSSRFSKPAWIFPTCPLLLK